MTTIPRTDEDIRDQARHELLLALMVDFNRSAGLAYEVGVPEAGMAYRAAAKRCQCLADELLEKLLAKSVVKAADVARERATERGES